MLLDVEVATGVLYHLCVSYRCPQELALARSHKLPQQPEESEVTVSRFRASRMWLTRAGTDAGISDGGRLQRPRPGAVAMLGLGDLTISSAVNNR